MQPELNAPSTNDICHRCMLPVPAKASRCPHCGTPQSPRRVVLWLAIAGVLALLFVGWIMVKAIQDNDIENGVPGQSQSAPR